MHIKAKLYSFIIIALLFSNYSFASYFLEEKCKNILNSSSDINICFNDIQSLPLDMEEKNIDQLYHWTWINNQLNSRSKLITAQIDNQKHMFRYIRDGHLDKTENKHWYEGELNRIKEDLYKLKEVTQKIGFYSRRINSCYNKCSPQMRIENESYYKELQKLKIMILNKRPILASPSIEELIQKESITDKDIKNSLSTSYSKYLTGLTQMRSDINNFKSKEDSQYKFLISGNEKSNKIRQEKYLDMVSKKNKLNPYLSEFLQTIDWKTEIDKPQTSAVACHYYLENKDYINKQKNIKIVKDVLFTTLPFLAGPAFRLGAWGLRTTGLLKWGMREEIFAGVSNIAIGATSAGYFLSEVKGYPEKEKKCENLLTRYIESENQFFYDQYTQCVDSLNSESLALAAEIAITSFPFIKSSLVAIKNTKNYNAINNLYTVKNVDEFNYYLNQKHLSSSKFGEAGFKLSLEKSDLYALNLKNSPDELKKMADQYWNYVGDTYAKRLNLTDDTIKSFVESSKSMADRTTLYVSTKKNNMSNFRGGVALVSSKKADDLLPFEKATGLKMPREKGEEVMEIVRLTVDDKVKDKTLTNDLISSILSTVSSEQTVKSVYIYTSKTHNRLYQRMLKKEGISSEVVHTLDGEVVLKVSMH